MVLFRKTPTAALALSLLHTQQNYVNCVSWKICKFAGCSTHRAAVCIKMPELGASCQHPNGIWKCFNIVMPHKNDRVNCCVSVFKAHGDMMEPTFPSDFALVCGCESKQGQLFRNKMLSFVHLFSFIFNYHLLQKDQPAPRGGKQPLGWFCSSFCHFVCFQQLCTLSTANKL